MLPNSNGYYCQKNITFHQTTEVQKTKEPETYP